jgi:SPP1 gp7 family putative phage head morphogenesis protein
MKQQKWKKPNRIEVEYEGQIKKLFKPLFDLAKTFKSHDDIVKALNSMMQSPTFKRKADEIAKTMATMVYKDGAKDWRDAARKSSKSKLIYEEVKKEMQGPIKQTLQDLIDRNAMIIRTLPQDISQKVVEHIQSKSTQGMRPEDIAKQIKKFFPQTTRANAKLIARTETSKASTALTQARSENIGIHWYVWMTSKDSRVRNAHAHMNDVICNYQDPPQPEVLDNLPSEGAYNAGEIYNCRCYAAPLVDIDDVKWPHKVHHAGKIQSMTESQFRKIAG